MRLLRRGVVHLRHFGRSLYHSEKGVYGHQPQRCKPQTVSGGLRINYQLCRQLKIFF